MKWTAKICRFFDQWIKPEEVDDIVRMKSLMVMEKMEKALPLEKALPQALPGPEIVDR